MRTETSLFERNVADLLDSARRARDQEITDRARIELMGEQQAEQAATPKFILGIEALALMNRIDWLYEHPKRLQFLGGSAIKMRPQKYHTLYAIKTPQLLTTDAEHVQDTALVDGYVFTHSFESGHLRITNKLVDKNTNRSEQGPEWFIRPRTSWSSRQGTTLTGVDVDGPGFAGWRRDGRRKTIEEYAAANPWVEDFIVEQNSYWGANYPFHPYIVVSKRQGNDYHRPDYRRIEDEHNKLEKLKRELLPQIDPRKGYDFPDDFYTFPIGLIRQAHAELGRTKRS